MKPTTLEEWQDFFEEEDFKVDILDTFVTFSHILKTNILMRTFEVTFTEKWIENMLDYQQANSHREVAERLPLKSKRMSNDRFREIEKTGRYYRITENCKGGKSFTFEIVD